MGYAERYRAFLGGQPLDLTDVPEGRYRLVHWVEAELLESDYENNAASMLLELRWPGSPEEPPTVEVLESCPEAARCLCGHWVLVIKFLPNADSLSLYRGRATSSPGDPSPLTPLLVVGALGVREVLGTSSTRHTNFVVRCRCEWVLHASTFLAYPSAESATEVQEARVRTWLLIGIHHLGPETRKRPERTR